MKTVSWETQFNIGIKGEEHCSKPRDIWKRMINDYFVSIVIFYLESSYRSDSSLPNTFRNSSPFSVNFFHAQDILDIINCIIELKKRKGRKGQKRRKRKTPNRKG